MALAAAEAELADERAAKAGLRAQVVQLQAALVAERSRRDRGQRTEERESREEAAATLKKRVKDLEVELESTRSKCLSA